MFLVQLDTDSAARLWPDIANALDAYPELWETTTKEDIRDSVLAEEFQVWMLGEGAEGKCFFVTCVLDRPAVRTFQVMIGLGEGLVENWPMILETLRTACVDRGCGEIEIVATRMGIVQLFRSAGFTVREMTLVQRVVPAQVH